MLFMKEMLGGGLALRTVPNRAPHLTVISPRVGKGPWGAVATAAAVGALVVGSTAFKATAAGTLTIYTYESFVAEWGPGPAIRKAYEARCSCSIDWVALPDGVAILNRLKLEGAATKADLVLGLDDSLISEAAATGLFAPHQQDLGMLKLPVAWSNSTFLPYDYAHFAVIYDSQQLAKPPTSLAELVDGPAEQKIIIMDPRTSTPGLGLVRWMKAVYGDKAGEAWARLKRRVLTVTPGWSEAYGLFTKGEAPLVFSYITSPAYHLIAEKSDRYRAAVFSEGHPLQVEVAAAIAGSPEIALARDFLAFMLTPVSRMPSRPATGCSRQPPPRHRCRRNSPACRNQPSTLPVDPAVVARERAAWTAEWLDAMSK